MRGVNRQSKANKKPNNQVKLINTCQMMCMTARVIKICIWKPMRINPGVTVFYHRNKKIYYAVAH